jgi:hypothetical protein
MPRRRFLDALLTRAFFSEGQTFALAYTQPLSNPMYLSNRPPTLQIPSNYFLPHAIRRFVPISETFHAVE